MSTSGFLASVGRGIARAIQNPRGHWEMDYLLQDLDVHCLATDPLQEDVVYAGTRSSGVLRSSDAGLTWVAAGLERCDVRAIAVSASRLGLIYAGTRPAYLYVSHNHGMTWDELRGFRDIPHRRWWFSPAEKPYTAYVQAIAPSPGDPDVVVVGVEAGATVRTTDGGVTWSRHLAGALRDCHSLAFHPTDGAWVYEAGGTGAGAAVSRDGGQTWDQPRARLDHHYGWACAADPSDPAVWYISAAPGPRRAHGDGKAQAAIYRMTNGTWQRLAGGLPQPLAHMSYSLLTDSEEPGRVYAGLANGDVWQSVNHGEVWDRLPLNLGAIRRVLVRL